jgi:hypothetical protein
MRCGLAPGWMRCGHRNLRWRLRLSGGRRRDLTSTELIFRATGKPGCWATRMRTGSALKSLPTKRPVRHWTPRPDFAECTRAGP